MSRDKRSADVTCTSAGGYAARVTVRGHQLIADEPEADGGTNRGPMPTELLLAALASCYTIALQWAAARRRVRLDNVQVTATGTYEHLRFAAIELAVRADFPPGQQAALLADASRVCYVSNTLAADVSIDVSVRDPGSR